MRLVVADTSPLFCLLSIDHIDLVPRLFEKVIVPDAVHQELCHPLAPLSLHADLILIDERKGTNVALNKGFEVTGTLGVLGLAARRGFVNLADTFARLKLTNFSYRQEIMDELLDQQKSE
jgi:predicted nucleic acid-binding protein